VILFLRGSLVIKTYWEDTRQIKRQKRDIKRGRKDIHRKRQKDEIG
jgi:hypothetical protein